MAAEFHSYESYVEKIFRLAYKITTDAPHIHSLSEVRDTVDTALKLVNQVRIQPYDKEVVLAEISERVRNGLEENKEFNIRLDELDELNPRDPVVEAVEAANGYSKTVTKEMIKATDDWINATVENECPDTSVEEDDDEDYEKVDRAIERIQTLPHEKVCVSGKNIDFMRFEILNGIVNGGLTAALLGDEWQTKFGTFLKEQDGLRSEAVQKLLRTQEAARAPRGGTKRRRKSKKKKRTKRKLK